MGYILRNILFIARETARSLPRVFLSSFGIILFIAFLVLFLSLREAARDFMEKRIFGRMQINQVKIYPPPQADFIDFGLFPSPGNDISDKQIGEIRRIRGIGALEKVIRLNMPASLRVSMFSRGLRTDILLSGVDKTFFRKSRPDWKKFTPGESVPVVIPMFVLDMYNNFAAANGLPELGEKALIGLKMDLIIGASTFFISRDVHYNYGGRVFGFTPDIFTAGIIVPSDFIRNLCRSRGADGEGRQCYSCVMVLASVDDPGSLPAVVSRLRAMNLRVESRKDIAERMKRAIAFLEGSFSVIAAMLLVLTMIAMVNAYLAIVYNRSYEFSLQRVLGASRARLVLSFAGEAAVVGALYGVLGYGLGYAATGYLSGNLYRWAPLLKGLRLAPAGGDVLVLSAALSALVSLLSALVPSLFASNLNLFKAIRKQG